MMPSARSARDAISRRGRIGGRFPCPFSRLDGNQSSVVHACASTTNQLGTKSTAKMIPDEEGRSDEGAEELSPAAKISGAPSIVKMSGDLRRFILPIAASVCVE